MIYGYVRVSTTDQNSESQKNVISRYCIDNKLHIDEWIDIEVSSKKSLLKRGLAKLIERLQPNDLIITTEITRLSRSMREMHHIIHSIVDEKKAGILSIKDQTDINYHNRNSLENSIKVFAFSLAAEIERNAISERTKEGLAVIKASGKKLGKPVGCKQKTQYDKDEEKIKHLFSLGVPIPKIIKLHLGYGSYSSLKNFIKKRKIN